MTTLPEIRTLFPSIEPFSSGTLKVSNIHTLYYEEVGTPDGIPVVYLHGGPGVGAQPLYRLLFDPQKFHAIIFSQRGSSKSSPLGELVQNDTWELIEDIEKLRKHLQIERWFLMGGSWGSTLGLLYAVHHPKRVSGLILRGIFLGRQAELDWLYKRGTSAIYPEDWQVFNSYIPQEERSDLVKAYFKRLTGPDPSVQLEYAKAWNAWEDAAIRLIPKPPLPSTDEDIISFARIECHFMLNHLFFPHEDYLTSNLHKLKNIPIWVAHGRYDMICPVENAVELKQILPHVQLHIIPDAGHSVSEPGITSSLITGIENFAELYWKI
jgi:proline iminopeptidase